MEIKEDRFRPFIVTDGLDNTKYHGQIKSSKSDKHYNVEFIRRFDLETKQFNLIMNCECHGFLYRGECSHCKLFKELLLTYNEIENDD